MKPNSPVLRRRRRGAIAVLTAMSGKLGPNGGLNTENEWNITGLAGLSGFDGRYQHRFASGFVSEFVLGDQIADFEKTYSEEDVRRATGMSRAEYRRKVEEQLAKSADDEGYKNGKAYWNTVETFLLFADSRFRRNKGSYQKAFLEKYRPSLIRSAELCAVKKHFENPPTFEVSTKEVATA